MMRTRDGSPGVNNHEAVREWREERARKRMGGEGEERGGKGRERRGWEEGEESMRVG